MDIHVFELQSLLFRAAALDIHGDLGQNPRFVPKPGELGVVVKQPLHLHADLALLGGVLFRVEKQFGSGRSVPKYSAFVDNLLQGETAGMPHPALLVVHILMLRVVKSEVFFHGSKGNYIDYNGVPSLTNNRAASLL